MNRMLLGSGSHQICVTFAHGEQTQLQIKFDKFWKA